MASFSINKSRRISSKLNFEQSAIRLISESSPSSIFVPLIVNTDGSNTPIGGGVDINVGWTESNWSFIGSSALTNNNQVKYISILINPYAVQELGQNDICIGVVVKINSNDNANTYINLWQPYSRCVLKS